MDFDWIDRMVIAAVVLIGISTIGGVSYGIWNHFYGPVCIKSHKEKATCTTYVSDGDNMYPIIHDCEVTVCDTEISRAEHNRILQKQQGQCN